MAAAGLLFAVTNVRFFFDSFPGALPGQAEIYLDNALVLRLHIVGGTLAILVGPMQFWSGFRDRHRNGTAALAISISQVSRLGRPPRSTSLEYLMEVCRLTSVSPYWPFSGVAPRSWLIAAFAPETGGHIANG